MSRKLFGTDGIRGRVNEGAIRPANFVRFGESLGKVLRSSGVQEPRVLIGRDTRQSGYMIESAILSGLVNAGCSVDTIGVVPTPAVGYLTREKGYDAGLMITASHNPASDNGVKVFGRDGFKLNSATQSQIEDLIQSDEICHVDVSEMGYPASIALSELYFEFARTTVSEGLSLAGVKICVDAAHGAGYAISPALFDELGAEVTALCVSPNGHNINDGCGAMHPERLAETVLRQGADIGIAFDGDADRIILIDNAGKVVDGDQIMGAIGLDFHNQGKLKGGAVVATIMSNLGLEAKLEAHGLALERTPVGDRYVVERMREGGFNVGGEQSGHIILSDYVTTGDAIISALQILDIMVREGKTSSAVLSVFEPVPQVLKNIRYKDADPLDAPAVKALIDEVSNRLGKDGRLVIRKSGTEPVIRVMVEAFDDGIAEQSVDELISEIAKVVGTDNA